MINKSDVLVAGTGVVGLTTAWELHKRGASVTVIGNDVRAGMGTSYANAGQLSFGYSGPWATPGLIQKVPGMLLDPQGPLRIHPDLSGFRDFMAQARWLGHFTANTTRSRFKRNKQRILTLSKRSKEVYAQYQHQLKTACHQSLGTIQLFRSAKSFDSVVANDTQALKDAGTRFRLLEKCDVINREPALEKIGTVAGGILFEDDETGDCHLFCTQLADELKKCGVKFIYGKTVSQLVVDHKKCHGVRLSDGSYIAAETVVLATGPWTHNLTRGILYVPIYPVRGYSMTSNMADPTCGPISTILDEQSKIAITKLGDRIRVGGTAEISGFNRPESIQRRKLLADTVAQIYPGAVDFGAGSGIEYWAGFRPMTPDGTPIIGKTGVSGLYINAGHGTLGWTQAAASADLCADVIVGKVPVLDPKDYELARYGRWTHDRMYWDLSPAANPA